MSQEQDYFDDQADFYDDIYQNEEEIEFYLDLAQKSEEPVLEVGCGTGRIYLELLSKGIDVSGIDFSREMLDVLEEKAEEKNLEPQVRKADMSDFEPNRKYGLVIIPARTFLHNITLESQKSTLQNIKQGLKPGGNLALNFFTPNFDVIREEYGEPAEQTIAKDGKKYVLTYLTEIENEVEQVALVKRTLEHNDEVILDGSFRIALISKNHFELLLETTSWSDWKVYGGFDYQPLKSSDQEMVWIAEK